MQLQDRRRDVFCHPALYHLIYSVCFICSACQDQNLFCLHDLPYSHCICPARHLGNIDGTKNLDGIILENVMIGIAEYYSAEYTIPKQKEGEHISFFLYL